MPRTLWVQRKPKTFADVIMALKPAGFWRFDEAAGSFKNLGSVGGVATPTSSLPASGGVRYLQAGALLTGSNNPSVALPGTNNAQITVPNHPSYNTRSFSGVFPFRCDQFSRALIEKQYTNSWRLFPLGDGRMRVDAVAAATSLTGPTAWAIQLHRWYLTGVEYDEVTGVFTIYLNGQPIVSGVFDPHNDYAGYTTWSFGSTGASAWNGGLDDSAWFPRAIGPDAHQRIHDALALPDIDMGEVDRALASPRDALVRKHTSELRRWRWWGIKNGVKTEVGEFGWPDATKFNQADADKWDLHGGDVLSAMDRLKLTRIYWDASHRRDQYEALLRPNGSHVLATQAPQAAVCALHPTTGDYAFGLNLSSPTLTNTPGPGTGGTSTGTFGNNAPGTLDMTGATPGRNGGLGAYSYEDPTSLAAAAALADFFRVGGRLERFFPTLGGAIDANNASVFAAFLDDCRAIGRPARWVFQNFGQYWLWNGSTHVCRNLGSAEFTLAHYEDAINRFLTAFGAHQGLHAFELMGEPAESAWGNGPAWETVAQTLVDYIRTTVGWPGLLVIPIGRQSRIDSSGIWHPRPFITDSFNNHVYQVHGYYDDDETGVYVNDHAAALAAAVAAGFGP